MNDSFRRTNCKIKNIKASFPQAMIIIKLEVMVSNSNSRLLFLKMIEIIVKMAISQ